MNVIDDPSSTLAGSYTHDMRGLDPMWRFILSGSVVLAFAAPLLFAQSAPMMHKMLVAESERLRPWAADKVLLDAVKAQNARNVPLAEIQKIDEEWKAGKVRKELTTGPCADRLRELAADHTQYVEVFVMDNQGALVCANSITSDYWQGDEPKWLQSYKEGRGAVFIDRPRYDESAKGTLAMISLPILVGENTVGVITVGVVMEKLPPAH